MSKNNPRLPPNWVLEIIDKDLYYNYQTGHLIWNISKGRVKKGDIAGSYDKQGYIRITFTNIFGSYNIRAHHICWYKYSGKWPSRQIDHRDGIGSHNWIGNLRLATDIENHQNRNANRNNKSGIKGVIFDKNMKKFISSIQVNHRIIKLGYFNTLEEAAVAYNIAELFYFKEFASQLGCRV